MSRYHPMQEIVQDDRGVVRFRANAIVRHLLDVCDAAGLCDMNTIATLGFSDSDRMQFAQLIGYSVSGFGDLSYAKPSVVREADENAAKWTEGSAP